MPHNSPFLRMGSHVGPSQGQVIRNAAVTERRRVIELQIRAIN